MADDIYTPEDPALEAAINDPHAAAIFGPQQDAPDEETREFRPTPPSVRDWYNSLDRGVKQSYTIMRTELIKHDVFEPEAAKAMGMEKICAWEGVGVFSLALLGNVLNSLYSLSENRDARAYLFPYSNNQPISFGAYADQHPPTQPEPEESSLAPGQDWLVDEDTTERVENCPNAPGYTVDESVGDDGEVVTRYSYTGDPDEIPEPMRRLLGSIFGTQSDDDEDEDEDEDEEEEENEVTHVFGAPDPFGTISGAHILSALYLGQERGPKVMEGYLMALVDQGSDTPMFARTSLRKKHAAEFEAKLHQDGHRSEIRDHYDANEAERRLTFGMQRAEAEASVRDRIMNRGKVSLTPDELARVQQEATHSGIHIGEALAEISNLVKNNQEQPTPRAEDYDPNAC